MERDTSCLQCFDAVGWVTSKASSLYAGCWFVAGDKEGI